MIGAVNNRAYLVVFDRNKKKHIELSRFWQSGCLLIDLCHVNPFKRVAQNKDQVQITSKPSIDNVYLPTKKVKIYGIYCEKHATNYF